MKLKSNAILWVCVNAHLVPSFHPISLRSKLRLQGRLWSSQKHKSGELEVRPKVARKQVPIWTDAELRTGLT